MIWSRCLAFVAIASVAAFACAEGTEHLAFEELVAAPDAPPSGDAAPPLPVFTSDSAVPEPADASFEVCAATAVAAARERLPVDIIWIVDNSSSMQPAVAEVQAGLNAFATLIASKGIDYKVVMLSKRGSAPITSGSKRYPVCIPPPLGGPDCGNGPRFFHASLDVKSTQPLEQFLGTLDQTPGYTASDERGSEPWAQELRANATKSIVIVSDDDSRFSVSSFEMFPGGANPNNSTTLPPGVLHPSRGGQFEGYVFNGIYGWESETVPSLRCTYPNGTKPAAPGEIYTQLVAKTHGVRARLCDGSAAWATFFDDVAQAVVATSKIACELDIPVPEAGVLDPDAVNVRVTDGANPAFLVPRVAGEAACAGASGWYYDDPAAPSKVHLCPASCDGAQSKGGDVPPTIEVLFGCTSVVR